MSEREAAMYIAIYAAHIGSDPQRDHEAAQKHARLAVARLRKDESTGAWRT